MNKNLRSNEEPSELREGKLSNPNKAGGAPGLSLARPCQVRYGPAGCKYACMLLLEQSQEWKWRHGYKAGFPSQGPSSPLPAGHARAAARHAGQAADRAPDPTSFPTPTLAREAGVPPPVEPSANQTQL